MARRTAKAAANSVSRQQRGATLSLSLTASRMPFFLQRRKLLRRFLNSLTISASSRASAEALPASRRAHLPTAQTRAKPTERGTAQPPPPGNKVRAPFRRPSFSDQWLVSCTIGSSRFFGPRAYCREHSPFCNVGGVAELPSRARKGFATRGTKNDATERRTGSKIFGRSGRRMAPLCAKSANRSRLAAGAIGKLDRAETENRTSIPAPSAEVRAGNRKSE